MDTQFHYILDQYQDIDLLKKDLYEYCLFMKEVFQYQCYFSDYYQVLKEYEQYCIEYNIQTLTTFQRHFILRCLFERFSFEELSCFVRNGLSDEDFETLYHQYFG